MERTFGLGFDMVVARLRDDQRTAGLGRVRHGCGASIKYLTESVNTSQRGRSAPSVFGKSATA